MSKKVLVTKKGSSPKNSAEAELLQGCFTRYNLKARIRQVKIGRMLMMLMMIIIAAVVNFGEAKQNHQSGSGNGTRNQNQQPSTSTNMVQSSYQCSIQKQYRPEGPIGIRYKKQILQGRDMRAEVQDSHMMEAALKKRHFLQMFGLEDQSMIEEDFQLQQLCPSFLYHSQLIDELTTDAFCGGSGVNLQDQQIPETTQNAFLSTHFYKPKYLHVQSISKPQESLAQGGIQIQLQQAGDQQPKPQDVPRDNSYLNLALNVLPSYELPTQAIDAMDNEQTIEGFLFKKAKQTNVDNFNMLRHVLGEQDHRLGSLEMFSRNSFTLEDPEFISNLTNGIRPIHIQTLKPQSSIYRFFTQEADITPQKTSFDECQLLIPKFELIKITNKQRTKSIEIKTMIASSPELTFYPPGDLEFPIKLKPQESIDIKVAYISETLGLFEAVMYIALDDFIFISSFNAYVIPNQYEIYPFYVTDINVNHSIELPLHITNPSSTDTLIIEELYSTESDVKLKWPHTTHPISASPDSADGDSVISHILVPEGGRKHLVNMVFEINRTMDFYVEIHIRTSLHDVLRVPLYYHVHSDVIKFTPNVIDFGLIPRNFDMLKIPLYARSKIQDPLIIQDVLLPIGDQRLDFQMTDFAKSQNHQIIRRNKDLFLGYALINPIQPGLLESKLTVVVLGQRTNKTYLLDVPIIAFVHNSQDLFGANTVQNQNDQRLTYPLPLVQFDVSEHILAYPPVTIQGKEVPGPKRKVNDQPNLKNGILQTPLILKNNFNVPLKLKGIVNANPELKVILENPNHYMQGIILQPGQSVQYAQVELTTALLKVSQGNKYISVIVNNTMIPLAISIFDRGLLCVWDQANDQTIGLDDIPFCTNPHEINFDYVAINDIKVKRLKITNMNPVNVTIEHVAKQQLDDLNVYIEKVIDKGGNQISIQNADLAGDTMQSIIGAKRTKRLINFIIQPYQTMQIVMQVLAKDPKQKFSRIDFQMKDGSSKDFSFNYKYHALAGTLTMVPQVLKFNPSYPGMSQVKPLVARSTFEVPITVKTITSNDMRIIPTVQPIAIRPNNKTEFGALQFDSSKQPILNSLPIPHLGGPQSIPFNNHEIATILQHHIGSFDQQMQQNLMQILNGMGVAAGGANIQQQQQQMLQQLQQQTQQHPNVQMINLPQKVHQMTQIMPLMTPQDIEIYREKQRMWEDTSLQNPGGTISLAPNSLVKEVTTYVTIETNVFQNITIPIRAQIRKPTLTDTAMPEASTDEPQPPNSGIQMEVIDFDYVQVGTSQMRNVKVINPTDEPFFFTLLLSPTEIYNQLIQQENTNNPPKIAPSPQDRDFYFKLFCTQKLELQQTPPPKDLTLSGRENFVAACQKIQIILESIANRPNNDESVLTLRRRLEAYLKELLAIEIQQNEQQMQQQRQKEAGLKDANLPFDIVLFEQELENITNSINQHSRARPLDQEALNIYRGTYEKQQKQFKAEQALNGGVQSSLLSSLPDISTILSTSWNILQAGILNRQSGQHTTKLIANQTTKANEKQRKPVNREQQMQQATRVPYYRLNNILLNELIINNDTSRLYIDQIKLADPFVVSYTGQSFFVNPRYQGQVYKVDPRSMLTLKDAVIFQPQSLLEKSNYEMKLLLKNNLTQIHAIDLKGKSGSGFLEVIKVLKKAPPISGISQDFYINAHMMYGSTGLPLFNEIQANFIDYTNLSTNTQSQQQIRERLIQNVLSDRDLEYSSQQLTGGGSSSHLNQREMLIRAANYHRLNQNGGGGGQANSAAAAFLMNGGAYGSPESIELNTIPFHLGQEDILIPLTDNESQSQEGTQGSHKNQNFEEPEYDEDNEYIIVNRILERAAAAAAAENNPDSENYQKIRYHVQTYHKRVLVVQNTGNLPLNVEIISLEDRGCQAQNFIIENCHPFILKPGETHKIHIGFKTDYTIAQFKRKLTLVSKQGVIQEYVLDVNIPVEHLKLANDLMPLTSLEEWQTLFLKFAILAVAFTTFIQVALDVFGHLKFTQQLVPDHEDTITYFEDHHNNFNIQIFKQAGTSQLRRTSANDFEKSLPPVIREQIPHDNVYHLYQQAQDKLMDNRASALAGGKGSQLLLKEVANLCSNKRQLVTIDAQKQAIKFELESRKVINARNQQYIKEMKEHQAALQQHKQKQLAKEPPIPPPIQQQIIVQTASYQATTIMSENTSSLNDSSQTIDQPNHHSAQDLTSKPDDKPKPTSPTVTTSQQKLISKKLKREIAQRQREQQEAEERFRQQQKMKELQEAANRQRQLELEEAAKRIKAQEEERRIKEEKQAALQKKPEVVALVKTSQPLLQVANAVAPVRHHQTEYEKRQMTQKLNNKSLNTPSKDGGDSSNPNVNSQRSPSCSSEVSQKSGQKAKMIPPSASPVFTTHPDQDIKVQPKVEEVVQKPERTLPQHTVEKIEPMRYQRVETIITRNQANEKPAQSHRVVIDTLKKPKVKEEQVDQKLTIPQPPPIVELDLKQDHQKTMLSKEDLTPFFQQQQQDKQQQQELKINPSTTPSPLLGPSSSNLFNGGSSIFSFNPLSMQGGNSQNQTPDTQANKVRPPSNVIETGIKHDFNNVTSTMPSDFGHDEDNESEEEDEEEDDDFQNQSAHLYTLFNTAKSLLARPSFGQEQSRGPKFIQKLKPTQSSKKRQNTNESFNQNTQALNSSKKSDELEEEIKNELTQGSLFSGSLFGEASIFATNQPKKQANEQIYKNAPNTQLPPSLFAQQTNNVWNNPSTYPPFTEKTFGTPVDMYSGGGGPTQGSALRRNQQELYPETSSSFSGNNLAASGGLQHSGSFQSVNFQSYPPPPGFGYKPQAQGQSLYAQYSSGFGQNQGTGGGPNQNIGRVSSLHFEPNNVSSKLNNNNSFGNYTGNSSGSSSLHYSQSYPSQTMYGGVGASTQQQQKLTSNFTPPKTNRLQTTTPIPTTSFHPNYAAAPQQQQQQQSRWPQNPHLQGGMIQPPPGLPPLRVVDTEQFAKQRNMMNSSSFFLLDDGQQSDNGGGLEENEGRRRVSSNFKQHMAPEDGKEEFQE